MIINCSRAEADTDNQKRDVVSKNETLDNSQCSSSDIEPSVRVSKGSSERNYAAASGEDGRGAGSLTLEIMTGGTPEWRIEGEGDEEEGKQQC